MGMENPFKKNNTLKAASIAALGVAAAGVGAVESADAQQLNTRPGEDRAAAMRQVQGKAPAFNQLNVRQDGSGFVKVERPKMPGASAEQESLRDKAYGAMEDATLDGDEESQRNDRARLQRDKDANDPW